MPVPRAGARRAALQRCPSGRPPMDPQDGLPSRTEVTQRRHGAGRVPIRLRRRGGGASTPPRTHRYTCRPPLLVPEVVPPIQPVAPPSCLERGDLGLDATLLDPEGVPLGRCVASCSGEDHNIGKASAFRRLSAPLSARRGSGCLPGTMPSRPRVLMLRESVHPTTWTWAEWAGKHSGSQCRGSSRKHWSSSKAASGFGGGEAASQ